MKIKFVHRVFAVIALWGLNLGCLTIFGQSLTFTTNVYNFTTFGNVWVAAADVNNDGRTDLMASFSSLVTLLNSGDGSFVATATNTALNGSYPQIVAADVNGDGKMDLVNVNNGMLLIFTNNGLGVFSSGGTIPVASAGPLNYVVPVDVNGDGSVDLFSGGILFTNDGTGHFSSNATLNVSWTYAAAADVNGDGAPDLIGVQLPNLLVVYTNNGAGVFSFNASYTLGHVSTVVAADVNGDASVDLVCGSTVFTNNGSGVFAASSTFTYPGAVLAAADLRGTGRPDLIGTVYEGSPGGPMTILTNNGSGVFTVATQLKVYEPYNIVVADFNGDGKPDLAVANQNPSSVTVFLNTTIFPASPLNIVASGNAATLFWNASAPNSVLETTTNVSNPHWVPVAFGTPIVGVTVTNAGPKRFFRLVPP